ncbi:MAG: hypothetical protein JWP36_1096 [Paucimonas sp.]|nr:hypothetical protein [Paucimonas sp.]
METIIAEFADRAGWPAAPGPEANNPAAPVRRAPAAAVRPLGVEALACA